MNEEAEIPEAPPPEPVETEEADGYATDTEDRNAGGDADLALAFFAGFGMVAETVQNLIRGQADPCQASRELQTWDTNIWRPNFVRAMTRARNLSSALQIHIADSIITRGRSGGTGQPLELYLIEQAGGGATGLQRLMPPAAFAGCFAAGPFALACQIQWVRNHLPLGIDILSLWSGSDPNAIPRTGDLSPSDGVAFTGRPIGTSRVGTYSGENIRQWVIAWVDRQIQTANPPRFPNARNRLVNLVGQWEGTGAFGIWQAPEFPESIFRKLKEGPSIYPTADTMTESASAPPSLGPICSAVSQSNWVYVPGGGGGDPILGGSRLYEMIRFRLFQNQYRECVNSLCLAGGGPDGGTPTAGPVLPPTNLPTNGDDSQELGLGSANLPIYAAAGLAAYLLARR